MRFRCRNILPRHGYHTLSGRQDLSRLRRPSKFEPQGPEFDDWGPPGGVGTRPPQKLVANTPMGNHPLVDWGVLPRNNDDTGKGDYIVASWAVEQIRTLPKDQPFFLAAGFFLPHVPCYATQKWFDLYPDDDSVLPEVLENDRDDTPRFSWYLHWSLPEPRLKWSCESGHMAEPGAFLPGLHQFCRQPGRPAARCSGRKRPGRQYHRGAMGRPWLAPGREADHRQEHVVGALDARAAAVRRTGRQAWADLRPARRIARHLSDAGRAVRSAREGRSRWAQPCRRN